ncbi:MAG TPA: ABC transporter permease subunit [Acidimicrobiia bacterium]|nr:ABC transporter permease subunit [Acidimicrobiia bacterium]
MTTAAPGLLPFIFRRAGASVVTLLVFVTAVFFLVELLLPWDTPLAEAGTPIVSRYFGYMSELASGSLGTSYTGDSVGSIIRQALPTTLMIFATGGILAYLLGSWLGRVAEWQMGKLGGGLVTTLGLGFYTLFPPLLIFLLVHFGRDLLISLRNLAGLPLDSLHIFEGLPYTEDQLVRFGGLAMVGALVVALILRAFGRRRGWRLLPLLAVPAAIGGLVLAIVRLGITDPMLDVFFFRSTRAVEIGAGSPVLAVLAFFLLAFGEVLFVWRAGIADERGEDYILTARAKAVPEQGVRDRHVARNVVLPVLSRSFAALPFLLTGLIIIEYQVQVGNCALVDDLGNCVHWAGGLSTTLFTAIRNADLPLISGVLITMGVLLLVLRLVAEIVQVALDPRLRIGASS